MIIDTHTHVGEACLLARTVAAVERGYPILPITSLIQEMERAGVSKAVLVQWGLSFDHHYLAQCLSTYPGRFAAVGIVDHLREDACHTLQCLVKRHGFCGVRLYATGRSPGADGLALWKTAADLDAIVSANARSSDEFVAGLSEVLAQIPKLQIRIEHLGRPPRELASDSRSFTELLRLADYENVYINLDGFYSHHYPHHKQFTAFPFVKDQAFVRQAIGAFGPERCMWGSEFPFINNGYDVGLRFFREACDFLSETQREWILGKTAVHFWRLDGNDRNKKA